MVIFALPRVEEEEEDVGEDESGGWEGEVEVAVYAVLRALTCLFVVFF